MPASPPLEAKDLAHVLEHAADSFILLKGEQIFISGGTGFVGTWLLETMAYVNDRLALGARATVLSRAPDAFKARLPHLASRADIRFVQGDVRTFPLPSGTFRHVIHAAAETGRNGARPDSGDILHTAVEGTKRVLEFAARAGAINFLYVSSGAVYGAQPEGLTRMPEDFEPSMDSQLTASAYSQGKRAAEQLCLESQAKIARGFAFVGPHLPLAGGYAIGNFIGDALAGRPIRLTGDAHAIRSYLYAGDMALWLWVILFNGRPGRAYNVGSERTVTILELAERVSKLTGGSVVVAPADSNASRPGARYVPSVRRAAEELGLRELIPLDESLWRTVQWHKSTLK